MRDSFVATLSSLAEEDERIILITGDLGFRVLDDFAKRFPRQFINAGVAEQNMTGLATGLALEGRVVFTYSIANFSTLRCLEQIRNDVCYHDVNVNVVSVGGGFSYGSLGISHHATEDLSIMRALPNLTVIAPSCRWEAKEATRALVKTPGAGYLRLDRSSEDSSLVGNHPFEIGKARQVSDGSDLTIISSGGILGEVLHAASQLANDGIHPRVLSMHTLSPLDIPSIISAARETGGIVTVEENTVVGGLGGAVAEELLESGIAPGFYYRIGLRAGFSSVVGSQNYLRRQYNLDRNAIANTVRELCGVQYLVH
ncbi:MAG: transketolase [Bacteroidetes bacterium]|nr:transketolase [Bacteroidota bacterium]